MRREELYLADLVDNARAVRGYLDGVARERWDADSILRDAVLYRMLLLGEIAAALPDDIRDRHPEVAWRQIRAFRNLAVHKYFGAVGPGKADTGNYQCRVPRASQDVRAGTWYCVLRRLW